MKTWMFYHTAILITIGLISFAPCNAQFEQWQPKKSRIEEQPPLIHETRGNWYLKQKYYKEAHAVYEQIRNELAGIESSENQFRQAVEQHQSALAKFYLDIGFAQGEVDGTLTQVAEDMKQLRERNTELTEAERKLVSDIEGKKKSLELLKKEFTTVDALTDALAKTMQTMEDKVKEAHMLDQRSWETVQAIAAEINDRKAEQMKLEVETNFKNLQQIKQYLAGNLFPFLQTKIQENETHITTIKDKAQDLRTHGTELSKAVNAQEAAALKKQKAEQKTETQKAPIQPKPGFFTRMWHAFTDGIKGIGSWFMNLFGSSQPAEKTSKQSPTQPAKP
jgi:chromosome segregation ATPase